MTTEFSFGFMEENCGCYTRSTLYECSFMKKEPVTLKSIVNSEIPLKHKYWFICKKVASKQQNQQIAIKVAEIVLPLFESRYPGNKAPREVIEAAKQFIAGHIGIDELREKGAAAAAAAITAYAAYAEAAAEADTYTAAYTTAYDAAYAAAYAYTATYDSADSAAEAAADNDIKKQLLDYLITVTHE